MDPATYKVDRVFLGTESITWIEIDLKFGTNSLPNLSLLLVFFLYIDQTWPWVKTLPRVVLYPWSHNQSDICWKFLPSFSCWVLIKWNSSVWWDEYGDIHRLEEVSCTVRTRYCRWFSLFSWCELLHCVTELSVTVEWWFGKSGSSNFDSSLITPIGILKFTSNPCVLLVLL